MFILLILFFFVIPVQANTSILPDPPHINFNTQDGLSNKNIYALVKDANGYVWLATNNGLNRFNGHKFSAFYFKQDDPLSLSSNTITALLTDSNGSLWVGTDQGLNLYDADSGQFKRITIPLDSGPVYVSALAELKGVLYVGTSAGIYKLDIHNTEFDDVLNEKLRNISQDLIVETMYSHGESIWVGTWGQGIFSLFDNGNDVEMRPYPLSSEHDSQYITAIFSDSRGTLYVSNFLSGVQVYSRDCACFLPASIANQVPIDWHVNDAYTTDEAVYLASTHGLSVFEPASTSIHHFGLLDNILVGDAKRPLRAITADPSGNLIVGGEIFGVSVIDIKHDDIQAYQPKLNPFNQLKRGDITSIFYDNKEKLLVGSATGLDYYQHDPVGSLTHQKTILEQSVFDIAERRREGKYWLATDSGIVLLDASFNVEQRYDNTDLLTSEALKHVNIAHVNTLIEINRKVIAGLWLGGVVILNQNNQGLNQASLQGMLAGSTVYDLAPANQDSIWIGTDSGIFLYNFDEDHLKSLKIDTTIASSPRIYDVAVNQNQTWLGTSSGIFRFQAQDESFVPYKIEMLNNEEITAIDEVNPGQLWIGTSNGLFIHEIDSGKTIKLRPYHALATENININSLFIGESDIYFGGLEGLNKIHRSYFEHQSVSSNPMLQWESITIDQQVISLLPKIRPKSIQIADTQSSFVLNFFIDNYILSPDMMIEYRVNANKWLAIAPQTAITLSNLKAGDINVEIRFRSSLYSDWQYAVMPVDVEVLKPIYMRPWALFSYALAMLIVAWRWYQWRTRQYVLRNTRLEQDVAHRTQEIQELHAYQARMFRNASHELKTPLTLIKGPLHKLKSGALEESTEAKLIDTALTHTNHLTKLVEDVLKIANVKDRIRHIEACDVQDKLRATIEAFFEIAQNDGIDFEHNLGDVHCLINADEHDFISVVQNLLSNACKFVDYNKRVRISLGIDEAVLIIDIYNSHPALSEQEQGSMFERFSRLSNSEAIEGNGLGLAYVREICNFYAWSLTFRNIDNGEVCFRLKIPCTEQQIETNAKFTTKTRKKFHLLLVEDNPHVSQFMGSLFSEQMHVSYAENVQQALNLCSSNVIDIIVLDYNIPGGDGITLAKQLFKAPSTASIPVLLVSADANLLNTKRIEYTGIIDFVSKPFDPSILQQKVGNILKVAKRIAEPSDAIIDVEELDSMNAADRSFLRKVDLQLAGNFHNPNFLIGDIAKALSISERTLARKLKTLGKDNPSELIKNYRLEKAKQMLKKGDSAKMVAYQCGFGSASYFSKVFRSHFGMNPREFMQS